MQIIKDKPFIYRLIFCIIVLIAVVGFGIYKYQVAVNHATTELHALNGTYEIAKQRQNPNSGETDSESDNEYLSTNTYHNDSGLTQPTCLKISKRHLKGVLPNNQRFNFVISSARATYPHRRVLVNPNKEMYSIMLRGHYVNSAWWIDQWKSNSLGYSNAIADDENSNTEDYTYKQTNHYRPNNILLVYYHHHLFINFSGNALDGTLTETPHQEQNDMKNIHNHGTEFHSKKSRQDASPLDCQQVFTKKLSR